jgi:hypothetical protein
MKTLWQDLRYGARMLMKQKSITAIAVLSLALGIGANTTLFSVVDAVMLKTLAVKEPDRLALFEWRAGRSFRTSGFGGGELRSNFGISSRSLYQDAPGAGRAGQPAQRSLCLRYAR